MGLLTYQKHSGSGQSQLRDVQTSRLEAYPMKDKAYFITRRVVRLTPSPRGVGLVLLVGMSRLTNYGQSDRGRLRLPQVQV